MLSRAGTIARAAPGVPVRNLRRPLAAIPQALAVPSRHEAGGIEGPECSLRWHNGCKRCRMPLPDGRSRLELY